MDLYFDMLARLIREKKVEVVFPDLPKNPRELMELIEMRSYKALCEIQEILKTECYSDEDCVMKIEEIVCKFEEIGSNCGIRHD